MKWNILRYFFSSSSLLNLFKYTNYFIKVGQVWMKLSFMCFFLIRSSNETFRSFLSIGAFYLSKIICNFASSKAWRLSLAFSCLRTTFTTNFYFFEVISALLGMLMFCSTKFTSWSWFCLLDVIPPLLLLS